MSRHLDRGRETLMDTFHRHRQASEHGLADAALERALQTSEYQPEASIWKGIEALPLNPKLAFVFLSNAACAFPQRADVQALVARSMLAQGQPAIASRYLTAAWQRLPDEPALRMMLWQARSQCETPETLRRLILSQLPDITAPNELALVLKLLAVQGGLSGSIGVVRYLPEQQEIQGWAVNLRDVQTPASLQLEANGHVVDMVASVPHPLLAAAGLPQNHGGIRIKVPNPVPAVHVRFNTGPALSGSPVFAMPAFKPPLPQTSVGSKQPVDVLIPVFDGLEETLECINSALAARKLNRTAHRLVVIEDQTPVAALRKALNVLAAKGKITLVQNPVNLGFIRSMNRAMALSPKNDVVWLNADTRVHGDWLDRLRAVAYASENIASVTPFTNNGELMSFPESRFSHPMPDAEQQRQLDNLARATDSPAMEIETGCGFCLYIKRSAIDQAGYLDEVGLSRGYGEETDWCLRARALGWRHMGAPNVFVAHQGGISFGDEKTLRVAQNNAILKRRYPDASARFDAFCLRDPIKPARQTLQRARLTQLVAQIAEARSFAGSAARLKQLHIEHGKETASALALLWRHQGSRTLVTLHAQLKPLVFNLDYELPAESERLLDDLRRLPVDELVFKQLTGCPDLLRDLPASLDKPYRIICCDDELLRPDAGHNLGFASLARRIELPWKALHSRYAVALPGARLLAEPEYPARPSADPAADVLLIADDLHDPHIASEWLSLARRVRREKLPVRLLVHGSKPWHAPLLATGAVHALPLLNGLTLAECVQLAGCNAALSLNDNPGASWNAPLLAESLGLALYAFPGPVADEAGAQPLALLPFSPSQR